MKGEVACAIIAQRVKLANFNLPFRPLAHLEFSSHFGDYLAPRVIKEITLVFYQIEP
jgi:hypothetical protein